MSALKTANARRQVGESTLRVRIKGARVSDAESYGTANLCTWPVGGGVCRFQTRLPKLAKKLSQRSGAQLVGWSVRGGYLRIFEEPIEPWRARHLVKRFLRATNGAFFDSKRSPARRKSLGGIITAACSNRRRKAVSVPGGVAL